MTENLTERYDGVRALGVDPDEVGVGRPAGLSLLKEKYEELPDYLPGNRKIGLTSSGRVVYVNMTNGRLGYYLILLRYDGVKPGKYSYRPVSADETPKIPTEPHDGFGDRWLIRPDRSIHRKYV